MHKLYQYLLIIILLASTIWLVYKNYAEPKIDEYQELKNEVAKRDEREEKLLHSLDSLQALPPEIKEYWNRRTNEKLIYILMADDMQLDSIGSAESARADSILAAR